VLLSELVWYSEEDRISILQNHGTNTVCFFLVIFWDRGDAPAYFPSQLDSHYNNFNYCCCCC